MLPLPRRAVVGLGSIVMLPLAALGVPGAASAESEPTARKKPPMRVWFGTTHAHTGSGNSHGEDDSTADDVFAAARDHGFDWFVLTEHSGPTGPSRPAEWYADALDAAERHTAPGAFVAMTGFEYSENNDDDNDKGHLTAYGTEDFISAAAPGWDFARFFGYLVEQDADHDVLAGFNHPPSPGHGASVTGLLTPQRRALLALTETHNHVDYLPRRERNYYQAMLVHLARGWRVAPTCGLDGHGLPEVVMAEGTSDDQKPCRTGILARRLTQPAVFNALRARRTFSSRDLNLRVRYRANGRWMGSQLGTPRKVRFQIAVRDPDSGTAADRIRRLQIIGEGGEVLAARRTDAHRVSWRPVVRRRGHDYMFLRVFTHDHRTHTALAAPVWLG